jgi:hypothetical protein
VASRRHHPRRRGVPGRSRRGRAARQPGRGSHRSSPARLRPRLQPHGRRRTRPRAPPPDRVQSPGRHLHHPHRRSRARLRNTSRRRPGPPTAHRHQKRRPLRRSGHPRPRTGLPPLRPGQPRRTHRRPSRTPRTDPGRGLPLQRRHRPLHGRPAPPPPLTDALAPLVRRTELPQGGSDVSQLEYSRQPHCRGLGGPLRRAPDAGPGRSGTVRWARAALRPSSPCGTAHRSGPAGHRRIWATDEGPRRYPSAGDRGFSPSSLAEGLAAHGAPAATRCHRCSEAQPSPRSV